jgi:type IV pilus assembly protein PilO
MMKIPIDLSGIDIRNPQMQKMLAIGIVSIIVSVLYLYFVFMPQVSRAVILLVKVSRIKADLISAKSTSTDLEGLKKKLAEYNDKVEWYEKKLPAEQEIPNLLENLSDMAKGANIKITSIMPVLATAQNNTQAQGRIYREIPIRITAKSGYHELGRFLSNLENSDRFMKVTNIVIRSNKAMPKQHDVELTVSTYILLPENK